MGMVDLESLGERIWGAVTRLFMPPETRRKPTKFKSSKHLAALIEWQYPPLEGSHTLMRRKATRTRKPR